jgi:hypothetical protein
MSTRKPVPIRTGPAPKTCPVCGKSSYSLGGIHPQCAVWRADSARRLEIAAETKAMAKTAAPRGWEKTCPKCQALLAARRAVCECGFQFFAKGHA